MLDELRSFKENYAWDLVDLPKDISIVNCKWVFKQKIDVNNKIRYRARLVARMFNQQSGMDFSDIFSPVVRHSTLRILFALSVKLNLDIYHLNESTAFLNGDLEETVFMTQSEGFLYFAEKYK